MTKINVKFVRLNAADYIKEYCFKEEFIKYCQACGNYGKNHSCPPYDFDTDKAISRYAYAHIICTKIDLNQDEVALLADQREKYLYGKNILHAVRSQMDGKLLALEEKYPDSKSFFSGSCMECEECARMYHEPCPTPASIRPSLEAFGFDMASTSEDLFGIKMLWSDDYLPPYYTLVSGFFTNHNIPEFADIFVADV